MDEIDTPYSTIAVASTGSMRPTIADTSILLVKHYQGESLFVGDIVVFKLNSTTSPVHRIVGTTPEGYVTQGDANRETDQEIFKIPPLPGDKIDFIVVGVLY